jgi:4-amino-4-deoxy-L-arabinose transferase-like glycosyltransferase
MRASADAAYIDNYGGFLAKEDKIAKKEIFFLLILIVAVLSVRLPHLLDPLDRDEGLYAYTAARTYAGELPYKDVFDHKPPFIYYFYRAAFDVFGVSGTAIRSFTSLYIIFAMLLIYMFARTFAGAAAAMLSAFFYCIFLNTGVVQGFGSNTEIFTHFTAVFSLFFLLDRDRTYEKAHFYISGLLMAAAILTNTMLLPACIVPVIYMLKFVKGKKSKAPALLWYTAGFSTLVLLAVLWAIKNSMLKEFIECNIQYNVLYLSLSQWTAGLGAAAATLAVTAQQNLLLTAAFLYSAAALFCKKDNQTNFIMFLMTVSVFSGILALKGLYAHYYSALIPYLAISAAFMIKDAFYAAIKLKSGRVAAVIAVFLMTGAGVFQGIYGSGFYGQGKNEEKQALTMEARAIGLELKGSPFKNASLFVWPNEPEIYFYSGLKARSRFVNAYPYRYFGDAFGKVYSGLMTDPPDYIVLQNSAAGNLFENLLKKYYSKQVEGKMFVLYKKGGM